MKNRVLIGLAAVLLAGSWMTGVNAADEPLPNPEVPRIETAELNKLIEQQADIVIVDTRDSLSYDYGHIKGAINIYYDPVGDPMNREMMLVALPMNKMIVLYCP